MNYLNSIAAIVDSINQRWPEIKELAGSEWPEIEAQLLEGLRDVASAKNEETAKARISEVLATGYNSPAGRIFREIMRQFPLDRESLVPVSRLSDNFSSEEDIRNVSLHSISLGALQAGVTATINHLRPPPPPPLPPRDELPAEMPSGQPQVATKTEPRYANAVLLDEADKLIDPRLTIQPGSALRLRLDIGKYSTESAVTKPKPLPELPPDIFLDVMVSSTDFAIGVSPAEVGSVGTAYGRFFLPGDGGPARTEKGEQYLYFYMASPATTGTARARINYYYNNHLVQSQVLTAQIGVEERGYRIEIPDFAITQSLLDIADLPPRRQVSILTNSNGDDSHQITIRPGDSDGTVLGQACTYRVKDEAIGKIMDDMREALRDRVAAARDRLRKKKDLEGDLRELAPLGRKLWSLTVAQCLHDIYPVLIKGDPVVIHVSRPTTADYTFPWSLIYDIPLSKNPKDWKLCPVVKNWDDRGPNSKITPDTRFCPEAPHSNGVHDSNTLCPYGFWGYTYDIEQLSSTHDLVRHIPVPGNAAFPVTAALTRYSIKIQELSDHIQSLNKAIQQAFPLVDLEEGKDLSTVRLLLCQDAPFVYFLCHGEHEQYGDPDTYLGIGNKEKLRAQDFQDWVQEWLQIDHRVVWDRTRPLIFINACHSLEIQPKTLVSYLDAFITTGNAAGVIGTEVNVQPSVAMTFAVEFCRLFFGGKTVGKTLRQLRNNFLACGSLYGLIYTPYCWSNLDIVKV
jgi:hypothetical protein